jgi:hypothetical protein
VAERAAEDVDEGAGGRPAASMSDGGDGRVVGQKDQSVVEPDLGAPLAVGQAEVVVESAREGAGAGADVPAEFVE